MDANFFETAQLISEQERSGQAYHEFLRVPALQASVPAHREEASTRTCDETTNDGSSKLDCIDDDD